VTVTDLSAPDGSYSVDRQLFSRFSADRTGAFYAERNGVLWFGSAGQLARFDTTKFARSSARFSALVRRISINQSQLVAPQATAPAAPATATAPKS